ncbi:MAG TPA: alpha/beta fold hydrolase [Flavobacterium sp.]|jgi:pimeloyl-ACP methyl ester carboxylesterase
MLFSKIEGEGRPLLILHGFLGMSDNWKTLASKYAENGFQVHAMDLRNHGRSFHSDEFTYEAMVGDLLSYCDFHNLKVIDIIGHSMGGKIAMFFAVEFPFRVNKLVVADIGPKYYRPHHEDIFKALNSVDFSKKPSRAEVDSMLAVHLPDLSTRQFLMKSLYWKTPDQLAFRFNLDVFNNTIDAIGKALDHDMKFDKPTLFVKGEQSKYIKSEDEAIIKHHFPNSKIKEVKNAGHWLHADNPDAFLESTLNFLK